MPMTGLEEMKAAIEEESRLECAEIGRRAQEQAATIREEAQAAAAARYQEIVLDARRECAGELQRAKTEGEMEVKRLLLRTKTELIDETIAMALRRLRELPDGDYFNVLQTLALSYARKGEGELLLSQRDLMKRISLEKTKWSNCFWRPICGQRCSFWRIRAGKHRARWRIQTRCCASRQHGCGACSQRWLRMWASFRS